MNVQLRRATPEDCEFAFEAKRYALGPYILARWSWDEDFQRAIHTQRWRERPWSIIEVDGEAIGTCPSKSMQITYASASSTCYRHGSAEASVRSFCVRRWREPTHFTCRSGSNI